MPTRMKYTIFNRRTELLRVPLAKAMFYEAYGNYCYGVFPNKQKVMLPVGLATVEEMLHKQAAETAPTFLRIGKRYIVNADMIVQVNLTNHKLVLSDFEHEGNFALPMSKEALKTIKRLYEDNTLWK